MGHGADPSVIRIKNRPAFVQEPDQGIGAELPEFLGFDGHRSGKVSSVLVGYFAQNVNADLGPLQMVDRGVEVELPPSQNQFVVEQGRFPGLEVSFQVRQIRFLQQQVDHPGSIDHHPEIRFLQHRGQAGLSRQQLLEIHGLGFVGSRNLRSQGQHDLHPGPLARPLIFQIFREV